MRATSPITGVYSGLPALGTNVYPGIPALGTKVYPGLAALVARAYTFRCVINTITGVCCKTTKLTLRYARERVLLKILAVKI